MCCTLLATEVPESASVLRIGSERLLAGMLTLRRETTLLPLRVVHGRSRTSALHRRAGTRRLSRVLATLVRAVLLRHGLSLTKSR